MLIGSSKNCGGHLCGAPIIAALAALTLITGRFAAPSAGLAGSNRLQLPSSSAAQEQPAAPHPDRNVEVLQPLPPIPATRRISAATPPPIAAMACWPLSTTLARRRSRAARLGPRHGHDNLWCRSIRPVCRKPCTRDAREAESYLERKPDYPITAIAAGAVPLQRGLRLEFPTMVRGRRAKPQPAATRRFGSGSAVTVRLLRRSMSNSPMARRQRVAADIVIQIS